MYKNLSFSAKFMLNLLNYTILNLISLSNISFNKKEKKYISKSLSIQIINVLIYYYFH